MMNTRAVVTALLVFAAPILVCCVIVLSDENIHRSLLVDFFKQLTLFLVVSAGIAAAMIYREHRSEHGGGNSV